MCGKLSFQIDRNIQKSFSLLVQAQQFNELKNNNVTNSTQKQLRVFVLYQISVNCAKIVIQQLRKMAHGNDDEEDSLDLTDDVITMLEECSFSRQQYSSIISGNGNISKTVNEENESQDMTIDTADTPSIHDYERIPSLSEQSSIPCTTSLPSLLPLPPTSLQSFQKNKNGDDKLRVQRLWRLLSSSIAGLVDCRRIDPYHSLSVHKISTLLRTLSHLQLLPPLGMGMKDIYPLVVKATAHHNSSTLLPTPALTHTATVTEAAANLSQVAAIIPEASLNITLGTSDLSPSEQASSNIIVVEIPDVTKNQNVPLGLEISLQGAFNESQKLFEKKRLQIVALWCLESATNGCERILQRTYKFDSLRRKMILQYFELAVLCDNYTAILTVLNWTLSVTCKLLTATLKWVLKVAVRSCSAILSNHCEALRRDLEKAECSRSTAGASAGDSGNTSSSSSGLGLNCSNISITGCENDGLIGVSVESNDRGGQGPMPMLVQCDSDVPSAPTVSAVAENTSVTYSDATTSGSNITSSTYSTCGGNIAPKGTGSGEVPQGNALSPSLQLLKRAYDLYILVSKVLDPSDMTVLEEIIIEVFSFNEIQSKSMQDSLPSVSATIHTSVHCDSSNNNSNNINTPKEINQADNGDQGPLIPKKFSNIIQECSLMWSSKSLSGIKRSRTSSVSRTSATATATVTASASASALVSQSSSSSIPSTLETVERATKISKGNDDVR